MEFYNETRTFWVSDIQQYKHNNVSEGATT